MKSPGFSLFALFTYLLAGAFVEVTHHDGPGILLDSRPVLASHGCGAKELHIPLDNARHCLACSQSAHRVSTQAIHSLVLKIAFVCTLISPRSAEQLFEADLFHSGKRGPPFAA